MKRKIEAMASHQRSLPNKEALLKSYNKRLKDDVKSLLDNFTGMNRFVLGFFVDSFFFSIIEIMKLAKVEDESQVSRMTQCEEDHFEMLVRASNIVRLKPNKLVSIFIKFRVCLPTRSELENH